MPGYRCTPSACATPTSECCRSTDFVDDLIEIRERYGFPRALETSWAKNKSKVFYNIVRRMKQAGLRSSFTLALQTLSDDVLSTWTGAT